MFLRRFAPLSVLAALVAAGAPARGACSGAHAAPGVSELPEPWRRAVEGLVRASAEPGHPWSCAGGEIDLRLSPGGATLRVTRLGEGVVERKVSAPEDVLPLGQALLALPLLPPEPPEAVQPPHEEPAIPVPVTRPEEPREAAPEAVRPPEPSESRLLLGAAIDGRYVGGSRVGWLGPSLSGAVPLGVWLPVVQVRQQSAVASRGPPVDEVSMSIALLRRVPFLGGAVRVGGRIGGASVQRDLPRPQGGQSRLDGRVGAVASLMVPVWKSLRLVIVIDGEAVALARATVDSPQVGDVRPRPFPTYTLGGAMGLEVPL